MLDRAQQSWPALSNTAYGAVAAARSRSASAKTMFGALAAQFQRDPFDLRGARGHDRPADLAEPVKQILRTASWSTSNWPTTLPWPGSTVKHPLRQARLQGQRGRCRSVSGVASAGLSSTARRRPGRGQSPGRDRHREVPRHDHAHHADRLVEGDVQPAGHRNLTPGQAFRRRRVVQQHVADLPGLPARHADGVAEPATSSRGQLLDVSSTTAANARSSRARSPGATARQAGLAAAARSIAVIGLLRGGRPHGGDGLLGGRVEHGEGGTCAASRITAARSRAAAPSRSPRRRRRPARPGRSWRSARPPPRRTPGGPARSSATAPGRPAGCAGPAAPPRGKRCRSAGGSSGSSRSMPCRPAAIIAATAR